jgi:outer membrane lipoprotein SlyB
MTALRAFATLIACVPLALAGCAPERTNTTYSAAEIGRTAEVSYGVIASMRPVAVQGQQSGVGTIGGGVLGGAAGSYIGGRDARANILGAVAGAIIGGVAGTVAEGSLSSGSAIEFVIREDDGRTITVVQSNEDHFQPGERVVLSRGARTRIARAAPGA